jgi:hypothetical protein
MTTIAQKGMGKDSAFLLLVLAAIRGDPGRQRTSHHPRFCRAISFRRSFWTSRKSQ